MTGQSTDEVDRCILCEPAPHENCDGYTSVWIREPPMFEDTEVRVCLEHYEAIKEVAYYD